ncbi:MAG: serine/threonine-protein kinase, partial [Sandaracinaceae bacterium]
MQLDAGAIVDRKYEVLAPMAEGGMGAVYRARHLLTEQIVALKVLNVGPGDEAIARRFKLEVSVAAKIRHPGIVKVFDAGTDAKSERFYLAMELLEGESLRDYMERPGRDPQRAVRWLADALEVMVAAHAQGVVHRDLKPENLFLEDQANGIEVKVLDFGIARDLAGPSVTTTGVAVGTALYMAPEQATASKAVGPAADVWAMGVMLYEVLGGERPFDGPSAHAVVVEAVTMPHRPLTELRADLSPGWGELVDACLAKKPEGRPSAAAVSRDLRALLEKGEALEAPFPLATPRSVPEDADTAPASALDGSGVDGGESAQVRVGAVDSVPQPSVPPPPQRAPSPAWLAAGLVAFGLLGLGGWLALGGDAEPAD